MPHSLHVGAECVAQTCFQQHVFSREIQHQLIARKAGRQASFASHPCAVVVGLQTPECPGPVEHFQDAADVGQRIRKFVIANRTTVGGQQQMLMRCFVRLVAPQSRVRSSEFLAVLANVTTSRGLSGSALIIASSSWMSSPLISNQPVRPRKGMCKFGLQSHRLAAGIGGDIQFELIVFVRSNAPLPCSRR